MKKGGSLPPLGSANSPPEDISKKKKPRGDELVVAFPVHFAFVFANAGATDI